MNDDLLHIRNQADAERELVIRQHRAWLAELFIRHPQLQVNFAETKRVQEQIISATLQKMRGQPLAAEIHELEARLGELVQRREALLAEANIDPALLEPKWNCPVCQDTGVVEQAGKLADCVCNQARRAQLLQRRANLPPRIANATFAAANFALYAPEHRAQAKKIYSYVQKFARGLNSASGQGLFIHGPTGSGKTYLLGCIANELLTAMSVRYMVYADFLDSLRATFNRGSEDSEWELVEGVKNVDLLLLDDLGVERPTEFAMKHLAQIIDYRYRNLKPLVVSSNFTITELIRRSQTDLYGERIVWRLKEYCQNILELKGNLRLSL